MGHEIPLAHAVILAILQDEHGAVGGGADGGAAAHGHMALAAVPVKGLGAGLQGLPNVLFADENLLAVGAEAVLLKNVNGILAEEHNAHFVQGAHGRLVQQIQLCFRSKIISMLQNNNLRSYFSVFLAF